MMISKSQFKPKALEYLRMVELNKKVLTLTHGGEPVIDILPHAKKVRKNPLDELKGSVMSYERPFDSASEDWEALK